MDRCTDRKSESLRKTKIIEEETTKNQSFLPYFFDELDMRMKIMHYTGIFVSMKPKEPIPDIAQRRYDELLHKG